MCAEAFPAFVELNVPAAASYADSSIIDVMVRLKGDPVLAAPEAQGQGTGFIDTELAHSAEADLRETQDAAEEHIRRLYPELEIQRRFTLTANGFICALPDSLISIIRSDPLVESITEVHRDIVPVPQLTAAKEACGITEFCNNTGCTGEGEVIAILDTEFDVTNDMFAAITDKSVKINKDTVVGINSNSGFSSDVDTDEVYISSKIPFAYDYSDNTPYTLSSRSNYHGTHVSGIAAGDRVINAEGNEISGIAPDAQLLMMKVYGNRYDNDEGVFEVSDAAIAAAIEDAVKLKADVINMSFGRVYENYDSLVYADSIAAAENAGIIICASAGNNANDHSGLGTRITVDNVDTGSINEPSVFPQVLSVASASITSSSPDTAGGSIQISSFSSYGVGTSLDIKPEIMGIGGNIESAAYGNTFEKRSGTSMASAYIAGCAAVYDQYVKKQEPALAGSSPQYIKNILMNSAVPVSENGIYLSPRRQGAGLAALDMAVNDKVVMTGASGKADIELRDGLGEEFSFELNITNISSEDVTFPAASVALSTDGYEYDEKTEKTFISGQTALASENDLGSDISVPAGTAVTRTVNVKLDTAQLETLASVFTRGFFVEGYVTLSGAENCCDISIPLLGFCGDWCMVPTIDTDRYPVIPKVTVGDSEMRSDISFAKAAAMMERIVAGDDNLISLSPEKTETFPDKPDLSSEQQQGFNSLADGKIYLSPNNDRFGDFAGCYYVPSREATFTGIDLYDSQGGLMYSSGKGRRNSFDTQLALLPDRAYSLPDGSYKGRIDSYINYGSGADKKQSCPVDVVIDTTAPRVTYETVNENGKKLLKLTAADNAIDGIYIFGMKSGNTEKSSLACFNALVLAEKMLSYDNLPKTKKSIMSNYYIEPSDNGLSDFQKALTGNVKPRDYYNFCDIIPVEPDENGTISLTYDVTELGEYSVTVTDRAYNETVIHSEAPVLTEFKQGVWRCTSDDDTCYYEFGEDGEMAVMFPESRELYRSKYSINGDEVTIEQTDFLIHSVGKIKWSSPDRAIICWDYDNIFREMRFIQKCSILDFPFYTNEELCELAKRYYLYKYNKTPADAYMTAYSNNLQVYVRDETGAVLDTYTVDRETGVGTDRSGKSVDLKEGFYFVTDAVWSGVSLMPDLNMRRYFKFTEIDEHGYGKGVYAYASDGIEHEFECFIGGSKIIVFSFDPYEEEGKSYTTAELRPVSPYTVFLDWVNGYSEELTLHPYYTEISEMMEAYNENLRLGDVNSDGIINAIDASKILARAAELSSDDAEASDSDFLTCDINGDGRITAVDASLLLVYCADLADDPELTLKDFLERKVTIQSR